MVDRVWQKVHGIWYRKTLHSGPEAPNMEDSVVSLVLHTMYYLPYTIYSMPFAIYHIRIPMFMWSLGSPNITAYPKSKVQAERWQP